MMPGSAWEDGYYAGLINDRDCPYTFAAAALWHMGNIAGLTVHCALVEAVYLSEGEGEK